MAFFQKGNVIAQIIRIPYFFYGKVKYGNGRIGKSINSAPLKNKIIT